MILIVVKDNVCDDDVDVNDGTEKLWLVTA